MKHDVLAAEHKRKDTVEVHDHPFTVYQQSSQGV